MAYNVENRDPISICSFRAKKEISSFQPIEEGKALMALDDIMLLIEAFNELPENYYLNLETDSLIKIEENARRFESDPAFRWQISKEWGNTLAINVIIFTLELRQKDGELTEEEERVLKKLQEVKGKINAAFKNLPPADQKLYLKTEKGLKAKTPLKKVPRQALEVMIPKISGKVLGKEAKKVKIEAAEKEVFGKITELCQLGVVKAKPASIPASLPETVLAPETMPASVPTSLPEALLTPASAPSSMPASQPALPPAAKKWETFKKYFFLVTDEPSDHIFSFNVRGKLGLAGRLLGREAKGFLPEEEMGGGGFSARIKYEHLALQWDHDMSTPYDFIYGNNLVAQSESARASAALEFERFSMLGMLGFEYGFSDTPDQHKPNYSLLFARGRISGKPIKRIGQISIPKLIEFDPLITHEISLNLDFETSFGWRRIEGPRHPEISWGMPPRTSFDDWKNYLSEPKRLQSFVLEPGLSYRFGVFRPFAGVMVGYERDYKQGAVFNLNSLPFNIIEDFYHRGQFKAGSFMGADVDVKYLEAAARIQYSNLRNWEAMLRIFANYEGSGPGLLVEYNNYNNQLFGSQQVRAEIFGRGRINIPIPYVPQDVGLQPFCNATFERNNSNALNFGCGIWLLSIGNTTPIKLKPYRPDSIEGEKIR